MICLSLWESTFQHRDPWTLLNCSVVSTYNFFLLKNSREHWTKSGECFTASLITPSLQELLRHLHSGKVASMGRRIKRIHLSWTRISINTGWENILSMEIEAARYSGWFVNCLNSLRRPGSLLAPDRLHPLS